METSNFVLIIHEVVDYNKWKVIFDNAAEMRKEAREISYQLLKYQDDQNKIVHLSIWSSHKKAKDFFESEELIKIRKEAGVKQPQFIYLNEIEKAYL
jgi:quinol monooxygenase YgiN